MEGAQPVRSEVDAEVWIFPGTASRFRADRAVQV